MSSTAAAPTTLAGFPALRSEGRTAQPPLLFLHGAFASHVSFAGWMDVLSRAGWRGFAVSRRGRGGIGPANAEGVRIADYVDDTLRAIEALGERPVVIGHSLGGLIAQRIAELGQCVAAVLLAPAPAAMLTAQPIALPALLPMFPKILLGKPLLPGCRTCDTIALNCIPAADRGRIHAGLVHESGRAYREMIFGSFRVDPRKVRCPILVVGGVEDRIVSGKLMRFTAERYGGELKLYKGHGHWILEEPGFEKLASDVGNWLETLCGREQLPTSQRRAVTSASASTMR
jgi:pimeloyl-ACP methyl ester carboxylesterase